MSTHELIQQHSDTARSLGRAVFYKELVGEFLTMDHEDAMQDALEGLVQAAKRFDPSGPAPFGAYMRRRVHGAVIDASRRASRSGRAAANAHRNGRDLAHSQNLAVSHSLTEPLRHNRLEARNVLVQDVVSDPAAEAALSEVDERLPPFHELIEGLGAREQLALTMSYVDGATQEEIGQVLGVHGSRVSQLLRGAYRELREQLQDLR